MLNPLVALSNGVRISATWWLTGHPSPSGVACICQDRTRIAEVVSRKARAKMILHLDEIVPGLVSHLDPAVLNYFSVYSPLLPPHRVAGIHPFVCLDVDGDEGIFAALSSSSLYGRRVMLPRYAKVGGGTWTAKDTYIYGDGQWFYGPRYVFQEASKCEFTLARKRNSVSSSGLLLVRSVVSPYSSFMTV